VRVGLGVGGRWSVGVGEGGWLRARVWMGDGESG